MEAAERFANLLAVHLPAPPARSLDVLPGSRAAQQTFLSEPKVALVTPCAEVDVIVEPKATTDGAVQALGTAFWSVHRANNSVEHGTNLVVYRLMGWGLSCN